MLKDIKEATMKHALLGAVAALALTAGASAAHAAIVDVTYRGVVTSDTDLTGIFGSAGGSGNLIGSAFQITYRFDTTRGYRLSTPVQNSALGGTDYGVPTPSLGAMVMVGSLTGPTIAGSYKGYMFGYNGPSYPNGEQYHEAYDYNSGNIFTQIYAYGYAYSATPGSSIPASIDTPFTYTVQPGDYNIMEANYYSYDYNTGAQVNTDVQGSVTSITETLISAPGPVPGAGIASLAVLALAGLYARARRA
jgi:hypothetical protein